MTHDWQIDKSVRYVWKWLIDHWCPQQIRLNKSKIKVFFPRWPRTFPLQTWGLPLPLPLQYFWFSLHLRFKVGKKQILFYFFDFGFSISTKTLEPCKAYKQTLNNLSRLFGCGGNVSGLCFLPSYTLSDIFAAPRVYTMRLRFVEANINRMVSLSYWIGINLITGLGGVKLLIILISSYFSAGP